MSWAPPVEPVAAPKRRKFPLHFTDKPRANWTITLGLIVAIVGSLTVAAIVNAHTDHSQDNKIVVDYYVSGVGTVEVDSPTQVVKDPTFDNGHAGHYVFNVGDELYVQVIATFDGEVSCTIVAGSVTVAHESAFGAGQVADCRGKATR